MTGQVRVVCDEPSLVARAQATAAALGVTLNAEGAADYRLVFAEGGVALWPERAEHGPVRVDFCAGGAVHRRLYGGGNGQMIAKAVGVSAQIKPSVFDATAGLGGDAFVLACLGCQVTMMERSPVAYALLQDGLMRAQAFAQTQAPDLLEIFARLTLLPGDSITYLQTLAAPPVDVVYLDPMFPERRKSAAVKKEMQAFHQTLGQDADDADLLAAALTAAHYRVCVKRARHAPSIAGQSPSYKLEGKSSRYDIYALKSLDKKKGPI